MEKTTPHCLAKEQRTKMKIATVCIDRTGYWVAIAHDTGKNIDAFHSTELAAYKAANGAGYIVQ